MLFGAVMVIVIRQLKTTTGKSKANTSRFVVGRFLQMERIVGLHFADATNAGICSVSVCASRVAVLDTFPSLGVDSSFYSFCGAYRVFSKVFISSEVKPTKVRHDERFAISQFDKMIKMWLDTNRFLFQNFT